MERVLFQSLNEYRQQHNLDTLYYSSALYKKLSCINASKMSSKNKLNHFDFDMDTIFSAVALEAENKYGFTTIRSFTSDLTCQGIGDIIAKCQITDFSNYKEIPNCILKPWLASAPQREEMLFPYERKKVGLAACSLLRSDYTIYVSIVFQAVSPGKTKD
jgi:hypothetical protein